MNIEEFSEYKTGQLVPLENPRRRDWAFIPNTLPPQWKMSDRLWRLVAEARQSVGVLDGAGSKLSNPRLLLRPLQRREALRSSSLEGTYVTPKQLLLFEKSRKEMDANESSHENEWREVDNYHTALRYGHQRMMDGSALDTALACDLHRMLMDGVRGEGKHPGEVRKQQVHVGVDWRFNPPPPSAIQECLANLEAYHAADHGDVDPLVRAFLSHYQFEAIHPFTDGNGRIGRVLLSLAISRWLNLSHPWLYLSEFFENHRTDYIDRLFRVSTHGEWDEWVELCLTGTIEQAESSCARCIELESMKTRYHEMVSGGSGRLHKIVELLFSDSPLITVVEVKQKLAVSYPTASDDLTKLEEFGILQRVEGEYPKMYSADDVLRLAYAD